MEEHQDTSPGTFLNLVDHPRMIYTSFLLNFYVEDNCVCAIIDDFNVIRSIPTSLPQGRLPPEPPPWALVLYSPVLMDQIREK